MIFEPYEIEKAVKYLKDNAGESCFDLIIKNVEFKRTYEQNKKYHAIRRFWIEVESQEGNIYTEEDSLYSFKLFLRWGEFKLFKNKKGGYFKTFAPKPTKDLSVKDFTRLIEVIKDRWLDYYGYPLPEKFI